MATSRKAFTQVRDILRKIDRSIDDARARRLGVQQEDTHEPARDAQATAHQEERDGAQKAHRRAQPRRFDDDISVFRSGSTDE